MSVDFQKTNTSRTKRHYNFSIVAHMRKPIEIGITQPKHYTRVLVNIKRLNLSHFRLGCIFYCILNCGYLVFNRM